MTVVVSEKLEKKEVEAILLKMKKKPRAFNAKKYFAIAKIKGDPLKIQQQMRDE